MANTPFGQGTPGKPRKPRRPPTTYTGTSQGQGYGGITVDPSRNPPRVRNAPPPNPVTGADTRDTGIPRDGPPRPPNPLRGLDPGLQAALNQPPPRPFDPTEETQLGINSRNETQTEAYLDERRDQTIRDYGLDDPTDPFSRARALQLSYQNRDRGNMNSYAARGQFYSGAYQNAINDSAYGYQQGYDSLRKGQNEILAEIERKRMLAKSGLEQANADAHSAALDRAVAIRPDGDSLPAKTGTAAPSSGGKPKKPKPGRDIRDRGLPKDGRPRRAQTRDTGLPRDN